MSTNCTMEMVMRETFYSEDSFTLFFSRRHVEHWSVNTNGKLAGAVICLFALSILMAASAYANKWILVRFVYQAYSCKQDASVPWKCLGNVLSGCTAFVNLGIGYLLMLAVMTYHTGMFLTIVSGVAVGKVIFEHVLKDPLQVKKVCAQNQGADQDGTRIG